MALARVHSPLAIVLSFCVGTVSAATLPDIRDAYGVALADYDRDGHMDIYLVGFRTLNRLLMNQGDGTFVDHSIAAGVGGNLMPRGVENLELGATAIDFDNDGWVDLLICGWGDALELLRNRGDGTFEAVTEKVGLRRNVDANMGVWGDLDMDGYLDLILTNEQGPLRVYRNHHGLRFEARPLASMGIAEDTASQGALLADLDGDGLLDLVVAGWRTPVAIYRQTEPFRFQALPLNIPDGIRANAILPGDIDSDGDIDLLVTVRHGPNLFLENQINPVGVVERLPTHSFELNRDSLHFVENAASRGLNDSGDSYGGAFFDYDGDGDLDLFLTGRGGNRYYRNDGGIYVHMQPGDAGFQETHAQYSTGFMVGDLLPNVGPEVVLASRDSACVLQKGPEVHAHFQKVYLHGVHSNVHGIGARLTLWSRPDRDDYQGPWNFESLHALYGGHGYLSSYVGPVLLSPLDSGKFYLAQVSFPNGKKVTRRIHPADSLKHVWEAGFLGAAGHRLRRAMHRSWADPSHRATVFKLLIGFTVLALVIRVTANLWARQIARKHYTRELEEKNRRLEELIEEVNRSHGRLLQSEKLAALGRLVAGIAHELNNPIGFIYSNLFQIEKYLSRMEREKLDPQSREVIAKIVEVLGESRDGATRIRDIVQNLRGISRDGGVQNKPQLRKVGSDLNDLLDKSLLLARTSFSKNIEVEKNYAPLPLVLVDATQIQQVLLNILVNAGQAMGEKGILSLVTLRKGRSACIRISDTGPGIDPEAAAHIFEPFFTTKDVGKGLGLGLHISYEIVSAHQGELRVESSPGKGACFTVELPLDPVEKEKEAL